MIDLWQESRGGTVRVKSKGRTRRFEAKQTSEHDFEICLVDEKKGSEHSKLRVFLSDCFSNCEFDCEGGGL